MKLMIDNGGGALDYTPALSALEPLEIVRTRGGVPIARGRLDLNAGGLPVPVRFARVTVTNDAGAVLFTGSLNTVPERVYAGVGTTGAVYTLGFVATADATPAIAAGTVPAATHYFSDGDGVLEFAAPAAATVARELVADVTLTGALEPAAYITESFLCDGTTDTFDLTLAPFRPAGAAALLDERFDRAALDPRRWLLHDPGGFLGLGAQGLALGGGSGFDGTTTMALQEPLELAGTLVLVADGVTLGGASDGVLCGLYSGEITRDACLAGFNVRQQSGATLVTPMVNGAEAGSSLTVLNGHRYRLRLRLHCPESVRQHATYTALADGALQSFGGDAVAAPLTLLFESQDLGLASNTPATVLHTTTLAASPAAVTYAPVNSTQLIGGVAALTIAQQGSAWITTTDALGNTTVRMPGVAGDGVDCTLTATGRISFFSGRVPLAGEVLTVRYRSRQRAVARLADATAASRTGAAWQGHITHPPARSSVDCENAAQAALAFAAARAATVAGSLTVANPAEDLYPGDLLVIGSEGNAAVATPADSLALLVRRVTIHDGHAVPERLSYRVDFANSWATGLGVALEPVPADDALLPATASNGPAAALASLAAMTVVSITGSSIQVDAGVDPPTGGGFEVRRRDWSFGPGSGGDLVLRSPVRGFTIPRGASPERFYVRMYSGDATPVYSRLSAALFVSLPLG